MDSGAIDGDERVTVTHGVHSAAVARGITADSDDQALRETAKLYGGTAAQDETVRRGLNSEQHKSLYVKNVREAYEQLQQYQRWLQADGRRRERRESRQRKVRGVTASNLRKHVYRLQRADEEKYVKRWAIGSLAALCTALVMVCSLLVSYTSIGGDALSSSDSKIVVTVSTHGGSVRQVLVGEAKTLTEITDQSMRSAQVPNNREFEMRFDSTERPHALKVTVRGEGMVGCRIELGGKILMSNVIEYQEATCQTNR